MATKTIVTVMDDLDGSEGAESVSFGLDGNNYEIDLNEVHAKELREALSQYIDAARRVRLAKPASTGTARRSPSLATSRGYNIEEIRAWAKEQGIQVADRGRVPNAIVEQYHEAQTQPASTGRRPAAKKAGAKKETAGSN